MDRYRFAVGDSVRLIGGTGVSAPAGAYQIVRRLPPENGQNTYRIKSVLEQHERVAGEGDLVRSDGR
jgi:hypothetical protein